MMYGRRTNRPAMCGGPYAAAVLVLLAVTLLHAVLALGIVRDSPSNGPDQCAAGAPNQAPAPAMPGDTGAPASARALAGSAPGGAPLPVAPIPVAPVPVTPVPVTPVPFAPVSLVPEVEEERSIASASSVFSARDGAGHPARHAGRVVHGASSGAHRSLSTSLGPLVLVTVRPARPAAGFGAFGAGGDAPAGRLSSRSVVLRC
ncbi:hypothetical protein GTZ78_53585 [Streptomyces sp. SID8361]|uniref:hypothetical protein n=1 Tax=Streptomyces sp. MnatMP-M27 TaxID=1839768 RepID=UPI00081F63A5|nr:hypothetical protein [Streptomyces sp. MnatMP-M27]MYU19291.1 hypothetical protein [Streptomyces sp. SID8361]SCG13563.1 hypothetical protein GA0115260_128462 [Streptomyces sp. MnatMP-M27]